MKKLFITAAAAAFTGTLAFAAHAQYTGPSSVKTNTVADVLKTAKDDTYVQLQGHIIAQVGEEKYTFKDKTGEIRVEIDKKDFTAKVDDKTLVEIRGEFEKDFLQSPEIDVDSIVVVMQE
ncbi:MAG: NirD/YgiW/YdeI family stress tolerance protein [Alphaproteobacteria bacterium]|nr:NirD/YgiW/YdeI family stress tolerance protein [Alphaproteobacteria bacterium]